MPVSLFDLELALEQSSEAQNVDDNTVYLNRKTGELYYESDAFEDEIPDDVDDDDKYLVIPTKPDLELGKSVALQFASEFVPSRFDEIYEIFSRKGAYQRYKALLSEEGKLDEWYKYEEEKQIQALLDWCDENAIDIKVSENQDCN